VLSVGLYCAGAVLVLMMILYFVSPTSNYLVNPIALGLIGGTALVDWRLLNEIQLQIYLEMDWKRRLLPWIVTMNIASIPMTIGLANGAWAWLFAIGAVLCMIGLFGSLNQAFKGREVDTD